MPRYLFSGRPGDFIVLPPSANGGFVKAAVNVVATGTAWTDQAGGTQLTDLLSATNVAITGLSTDADGYLVAFQGPLNVSRLWVDFGAGTRRLLESQVQQLLTAQDVSDATVLGRSLMTAADTATAQTLLHIDPTNVTSNAVGTTSNPVLDAAAVRPTGLTVVWWETATAPVNGVDGDIWLH